MPRFVCERCGLRSRTPAQFEAHRAIHDQLPTFAPGEPSGLPEGVEAVLSSAPESVADDEPEAPAPTGVPDEPIIEPFELPTMPEFERGERSEGGGGFAPAEPAPEPQQEILAPAFTESDIAGVLKAVFDFTAELAHTGPAGRLSDAEAKLIANLSRDWINRQVAANFGNDAGQAKMLVAVGLIVVTKSRVYYVAIRKRRSGVSEDESAPAVEDTDDYAPRIIHADSPPVQNAPPSIHFGDRGGLGVFDAS